MDYTRLLQPLPSMSSQHKSKAVFLDKDGTLVENIPFNVDPSLVRLSRRTLIGLQMLQGRGFKIIIVSNQSGVARGYFKEEKLTGVRLRVEELLGERGISICGFYYCPHHPDGNVTAYSTGCDCRKPNDGLLRRAAVEHNIDLGRSWMIGDILDDIEAGNRAGCRSILIDNKNETEWHLTRIRTPFAIVDSINEAANIIIENQYEFLGQLS